MTRCSVDVVCRDPYRLPPNTTVRQCRNKAVTSYIGRPICQRHRDMYARQLARAKVRQDLRRRQLERKR